MLNAEDLRLTVQMLVSYFSSVFKSCEQNKETVNKIKKSFYYFSFV